MVSKLVITSVEKLQKEVEKTLRAFDGGIGIYVSLNKTQKSLELSLRNAGLSTDKIFFIDGVTAERTNDEVLHIPPQDIDQILFAIKDFHNKIKGEKFLVIDALSTLLIYNAENKVAGFVSDLCSLSSDSMRVVAFSPDTKGEDLLAKIFNFFDEVVRDG